MTLSAIILKTWVRQWVERKRSEDAQSALLLEALREVKIDVSRFSHLSEDVTVRILSHCTTTDLQQCLFVDRRLSRLVLEQRNSAATILLRTKYSEIKKMFPAGPRFWASDVMQADFYTMLWPEAEMVIRSLKRRQEIARSIMIFTRGHVSASTQNHYSFLFNRAFGTFPANSKWIRMGVWMCQILTIAHHSGYVPTELFDLLNGAPTIALLCIECFLGQQVAVDELMDQLSRYPRSTARMRISSFRFSRKNITCDALLHTFIAIGTCGIRGESSIGVRVFKDCANIFNICERARSRQPYRTPEKPYDSFYAKCTEAKTPGLTSRLPRLASFISHQIVDRRKEVGWTGRHMYDLQTNLLFEELKYRARSGEVDQLMTFARSCTSIAMIDMAKRGSRLFRLARLMARTTGDDDQGRRLPHEVYAIEVP